MAYTTQYIGSRYVPLFAEPAEWNSARTYEPLTIVMHDGNSYTSRQYVPAGIEITNEKFWALTGNYNAQVEQYRQEVKNLDGRVTANTSAIETETTNRTAAVTAEKTRAEGAEQTLQTNIDAEKTRAENAEQALQTNIDAEKTRAENAEKILERKFTHKYNTVNDMIADTSLGVGMIAQTLHYANIGDNGGATYVISNNAPGIIDIQLNNGNTAGYVFQNEMHADQFPFALDKNLFTLFMNSTARVLDLDNRTLVYPCSDGVPNGDKTIRNGSITVNSYMFSIGIDDSYTGNITLDNLDITCVIPSTAKSGTWSLRAPSSTSTYTITSCHISCKAIYGGGWCPLYTLADNLIIKDNYIDASNLASTDEGGCIWVLSYEDNPKRNTITITNNHLVANGVDEALGLRNNNFSYTVVANNLIEGINNQRNFLVTLTETDHTKNHGIIFFHDNTIIGDAIDTQIEVSTLAICRNNYHPTGSYGLSATSDGREPSIDNELVKSVKVRNAMTLHNCLITGYVRVDSDDTVFVGGTIGNIYPRETNAQFINCILTGTPNNMSNCYYLDTSKTPISNLNVADRVLHWTNVNSNKPLYFQNTPSKESFISTATDISLNYTPPLKYATSMAELKNCTFTVSAPHLQGHKNAS